MRVKHSDAVDSCVEAIAIALPFAKQDRHMHHAKSNTGIKRPIALSKRRKAYIATLKKVAEKYKDRPFSYLWTQGGSHPGLESSVGVGGFGEFVLFEGTCV